MANIITARDNEEDANALWKRRQQVCRRGDRTRRLPDAGINQC